MTYSVSWNEVPTTLDEMLKFKEASLQKPEYTAALTVAALTVYPQNKEEAIKMLNYLRGPRPLSVMDQQFIRDRFMDGKGYIPWSYFDGATPENEYTPIKPFTIFMEDSHAAIAEKGYRILDLKSGGADHARSITLRLKPSTGEWFLWKQHLLAGIRIPKSMDAWS